MQGSPPIHSFFKATPPTQAAAATTGPTQQQATPPPSSGPRPKRLHFTTPLTQREDGYDYAQAKNPSLAVVSDPSGNELPHSHDGTQEADAMHSNSETAEEESPDDDVEMHVDFF